MWSINHIKPEYMESLPLPFHLQLVMILTKQCRTGNVNRKYIKWVICLTFCPIFEEKNFNGQLMLMICNI